MDVETAVTASMVSEPHIGGEAFDLGDEINAIVRRWKDNGELIILFPEEYAAPGSGILIGSYMRVGQHSVADYNVMLEKTVPVDYNDEDVLYFIRTYERWVPCQLKLYKKRTAKMHERWLKERDFYCL